MKVRYKEMTLKEYINRNGNIIAGYIVSLKKAGTCIALDENYWLLAFAHMPRDYNLLLQDEVIEVYEDILEYSRDFLKGCIR